MYAFAKTPFYAGNTAGIAATKHQQRFVAACSFTKIQHQAFDAGVAAEAVTEV
jgi:hypothetical protein